MPTLRSCIGLVGLAAIAAGCAQSPTSSAPAVTAYRLQAVTLDWSGSARPNSPWRAERPITQPRRSSGGWGQEYPWRGPGQTPAWYGVHAHVPGRYVLVGQIYYPYYFEGGQIYPVYSMPYTLNGHRFVPVYGQLPAFGPYVVTPESARLFRHTQGLLS